MLYSVRLKPCESKVLLVTSFKSMMKCKFLCLGIKLSLEKLKEALRVSHFFSLMPAWSCGNFNASNRGKSMDKIVLAGKDHNHANLQF